MATDDSLLRPRPKSTILDDIRSAASRGQEAAREPEPAAAGEEAERIDPLPRRGNAYAAHARHTSRPLVALFIVDKDGMFDSFAYADLRRCHLVATGEAGKGPVLLLRFNDAELQIEGRKLYSLCHLIGMHQMPWIWEHPAPEDFSDHEATLIRKITVKLVE